MNNTLKNLLEEAIRNWEFSKTKELLSDKPEKYGYIMVFDLYKDNKKNMEKAEEEFYKSIDELEENDMVSSVPHKCPVCEGRGVVAEDFYKPYISMSTSIPFTVKCKSCGGPGIIYT